MIEKTLGKEFKVEHVGSTSILGMGGKNIVDILIGVNKDLFEYVSILENQGFEYSIQASTQKRLFFKKMKDAASGVHLHVTTKGSKDWVDLIRFRDYLISHPNAVLEYEKLKKDAIKYAKGNGKLYKDYKNNFIRQVINKED